MDFKALIQKSPPEFWEGAKTKHWWQILSFGEDEGEIATLLEHHAKENIEVYPQINHSRYGSYRTFMTTELGMFGMRPPPSSYLDSPVNSLTYKIIIDTEDDPDNATALFCWTDMNDPDFNYNTYYDIGRRVRVSEAEALKLDRWTFDVRQEKYYIYKM